MRIIAKAADFVVEFVEDSANSTLDVDAPASPAGGGIVFVFTMPRAEVSPSLLRWARDRAGIPMEVPAERFTKLPEWEQGTSKPTLKKVEALSVPLDSEISDLARRFKVSTLVIIRRLRDAGFFSKAAFSDVFDAEMTRLLAREKGVVK